MKRKKENNLQKSKGITLIALVVTIIVLIILAVISINIVFGDEGLIVKAREAQDKQKIGEYLDRFALAETNVAVENDGIVTLELFIEQIKKEGIIAEENIEKTGETTYKLTSSEGYIFEAVLKAENDVEVNSKGIGEAPDTSQEPDDSQEPDEPQVGVTGVTLSESNVSMYVKGWEVTLNATIEPSDATNKNVTWSSSDTEVATVDANGVISALAVGTATITVTTADGSKTAECTVEVTIAPAGTLMPTPESWTSEAVTSIADGSGNIIPLPDGYFYIGGNRSEGLVISDKEGDSMTASGTTSGSQFVWIPVDTEAAFKRTQFKTTDHEEDGEYTEYELGEAIPDLDEGYTEPFENGYSDGNGTEEKAEYDIMRTQVLLYKGFYIGRYESGINSTELRTTYSTAQEVVVKRGVAPYNWIPWGTSISDESEIEGKSGAVYLAKNKYAHDDSVVSTICYGSQWDAMCRYIGDSHRTTATKEDVGAELTGSVLTDVSKNIYDLAGNCYEWTMEAGKKENRRVIRGGDWEFEDNICGRYDSYPYNETESDCFRIALYIK